MIPHLGGIGQGKAGRLYEFEGQVDTCHLVLGAAQRAQDDELLVRFRQDGPFTSPGSDERANGKTHVVLPKIFGCWLIIASQASSCSKRMTT